MRLLLDAHAFLYFVKESEHLSARARELRGSKENQLFLSAASGWEMAMKTRVRRLHFVGDDQIERFIPEQMTFTRIESLPVEMSHALRTYHLPALHRDPFDRLLIVQSQAEEMPILTRDPAIAQYEVETVW